ncbi:hypothetical protein F5X96DRAFT_689451 [Biscogniauxia mediterranea]|nr:hypothetical protein F5X96DRAFT_689451 [Biscogniauxia mediterranea]
MADMILPKGIVFNKNTIYETIAEYDVVPIEQILQACHVFSTTSRELDDPTARRLENFWTRVLGGDRRYLPGTVIARLFRHISEEPPFIKLLGPPNRYEPPSPGPRFDQSGRLQAVLEESTQGLEKSKSEAKARAALPISSKVLHPILKKPRRPSASGPRPTARFASPPGSDAEEDGSKGSEAASSGSTAVTHSAGSKGSGSSTAKEEKKKATGTPVKKKSTAFVASTASRRRPAMLRRPSSQTSTGGAESGSKESSSSTGSKHGGLQSVVPTTTEKLGKSSSSSTREKEGSERLSAKAAGKRPMNKSPTRTSAPAQPVNPQTKKIVATQEKATGSKQTPSTVDSKNKSDSGNADQPEAGQSEGMLKKGEVQERSRPGTPSLMNRSRSDMGSRDPGRGRLPNLLSASTATISNATAQGTIIEYDENGPANEAVTNAMRELEDNPEPDHPSRRTSGSSILDSRLIPTQPSNAPPVPLGRSKSQLTLLLERQGEKKNRR